MQEIIPGDIVVLKSGGPNMTVTHVREGKIFCTWFEGVKQHFGDFPPVSIKKIDA